MGVLATCIRNLMSMSMRRSPVSGYGTNGSQPNICSLSGSYMIMWISYQGNLYLGWLDQNVYAFSSSIFNFLDCSLTACGFIVIWKTWIISPWSISINVVKIFGWGTTGLNTYSLGSLGLVIFMQKMIQLQLKWVN